MRRIVSILLLAVFGLPFALPLLAMGQRGEARLPACCRRDGKHHCTMGLDEHGRLASHDARFRAPTETCPYNPGSFAPAPPTPLAAPSTAALIDAALVSDAAGVARTKAMPHVFRDRSHPKRGPPTRTIL